AIIALAVAVWAPMQKIRPLEALAIGLIVFVTIVLIWGRLKPRSSPRLQKPPASPDGAPDLRISYIGSDRQSKLVLENKRSDTTATIRKISPLTSQAFYEGEYPLTLLKSTFPPLDFGIPVECEI